MTRQHHALAEMLAAATIAGTAAVCCGNDIVLPLWPQGVPDAKGNGPADNPSITVHLPAAGGTNRAALLICPGGGYGGLCSSYEGHDVAAWLNRSGMAGIVLKYRLNPYRHPVPLQDARRAMRLVRLHASEWGLDAHRLGVMGFSAGGHLASTLGTQFDAGEAQAADPVERLSCRPDFMVLVYPVISMGAKGHAGSTHNLLGPNPTPAARDSVSSELHVTADTPMAFLAHAVTDAVVPVDNSRMFVAALKAKGVPVTYFELPKGNHGLGCGKGEEWAAWQAACLDWLKAQGLESVGTKTRGD